MMHPPRSPHRGQSDPLQGTSAVLKFSGSFTISAIEFFSMHHKDTMMLFFGLLQIMPWRGGAKLFLHEIPVVP